MLGPLGEAQARIENDHGRVHPGLRHHVDPAAQFLAHLRHHILVDGPGIHAVAVTPPVHHHVGNSRGRDEPGHLGIGQATAHVVDQPGPRLQGPLGHLGPHRVHADRDTRRGQALDDRPGPAQFLCCGDALRTRAGGLPAHVHDVRALGQEFQAVPDPGLRAEPLAPVGEGVGGDVHHAHDQAPSRVGKPRRAGCPGRVDDHGVTLRGHLPVPPALARRSLRAQPRLTPGGPPAPRAPSAHPPRARLGLSRRRFPGTGQIAPECARRAGRVARTDRYCWKGVARRTLHAERAPEPDNSPVAAHVAREVSPEGWAR